MIRKKVIIGIILSILSFSVLSAQESYKKLIFDGNHSFDKKNYDKSSVQFQKATQLKERDFTAHFNLGNALYKSNKFEEAKVEYAKAATYAKNKADKAAALYNSGNSSMKLQKPEQAAQLYTQALTLDPFNENISKNLQLAELKKQEQKQDGDGNKQKQQNQQDQNQQENQDQKSKQEQGNKSAIINSGSEKEEQQNPTPSKENDNMPKDLEDAILNRMDNKEKETARRILNKNTYSQPQSKQKDW